MSRSHRDCWLIKSRYHLNDRERLGAEVGLVFYDTQAIEFTALKNHPKNFGISVNILPNGS